MLYTFTFFNGCAPFTIQARSLEIAQAAAELLWGCSNAVLMGIETATH